MRFGKRQNPQLCELSKVLRCGPADRRGAPRYAERRKVELVFTGTESPLGRLDWPTSATESTEWRFWGGKRGDHQTMQRTRARPLQLNEATGLLSHFLSLSRTLVRARKHTHTHTQSEERLQRMPLLLLLLLNCAILGTCPCRSPSSSFTGSNTGL